MILSRAFQIVLLCAAGVAHAGSPDPRVWIGRMNDALINRSYDGVFVHQVSGKRETMRIIHRVRDGKMVERLLSTDGSGREFVRNGSEWTAYYPDRKMVVVEQRNRSGGFMSAFGDVGPQAEQFYLLRDAGQQRLQGVTTRVILVEPNDRFRYGYRFWIAEKTGMPYRTQLVSANNEVIEDISFISLSLPAAVDDELLKPDVDATGFRWLRRDTPNTTDSVGANFAPQEAQLPPGFRVKYASPAVGVKEGPRSRFIISDGIAWVSVFVEPTGRASATDQHGQQRYAIGAVQMGSYATYTQLLEGHRVTAVGEVPAVTVKAIAQAVGPE
jgi:sigma-E factor negative regulatory protein RseB